jgi:hypothetical protein
MTHADDRAARLHVEMLEAWKHRGDFGTAPAVRIVHIVGGRHRIRTCRLRMRVGRSRTRQRRTRRERLNQMPSGQRFVSRALGLVLCHGITSPRSED